MRLWSPTARPGGSRRSNGGPLHGERRRRPPARARSRHLTRVSDASDQGIGPCHAPIPGAGINTLSADAPPAAPAPASAPALTLPAGTLPSGGPFLASATPDVAARRRRPPPPPPSPPLEAGPGAGRRLSVVRHTATATATATMHGQPARASSSESLAGTAYFIAVRGVVGLGTAASEPAHPAGNARSRYAPPPLPSTRARISSHTPSRWRRPAGTC